MNYEKHFVKNQMTQKYGATATSSRTHPDSTSKF